MNITWIRKLPTIAAAVLAAGFVVTAPDAVADGRGDTGQLTVYHDLSSFQAAIADLGDVKHEDFEGGFTHGLPSVEFSACREPVDSRSNDACFQPGGVLDGIHIRTSNGGWGVLVFNSGIFGTADRVIGAWPYRLNPPPLLNFTVVEFDAPPTAVGADVYGAKLESGSPSGVTVPVQVDAYASDASLIGSVIVQQSGAYSVPEFVGVTSPVPIAKIVYGTRTEVAAAPIDNLYFAGGNGRLMGPESLAFGAVAVYDVADLALELTNTGYLDLVVGSVAAPSAPFSEQSDACSGATLAPGASCTIGIGFSPTYQDQFVQELEIPVDAGAEPATVTLRGSGVLGESLTARPNAGLGDTR